MNAFPAPPIVCSQVPVVQHPPGENLSLRQMVEEQCIFTDTIRRIMHPFLMVSHNHHSTLFLKRPLKLIRRIIVNENGIDCKIL